MTRKEFIKTQLLLGIILCIAAIAAIATGAEKLQLLQPGRALFSDPFVRLIIVELRLPRTLLVCLCGALLAGAGMVFQGYFRNSLADPAILGVSSGATLGTVAGNILFSGGIAFALLPAAGFAGALLGVAAVYLFAGNTRKQTEPVKLLLAGSAVNVFFSAAASLLLLLHDKELHKMYVWMLGSFNGKSWNDLRLVCIPAAIAVFLMAKCARPLDILAAGSRTAQSLGLDIKYTRLLCIAAGSLASAAAVCTAGTIGFIGLAAPHIIRFKYRCTHRQLLPLSMTAGAALLCVSDMIARTAAAPSELPVGVITAFAGAPLFLWILHTKDCKK